MSWFDDGDRDITLGYLSTTMYIVACTGLESKSLGFHLAKIPRLKVCNKKLKQSMFFLHHSFP